MDSVSGERRTHDTSPTLVDTRRLGFGARCSYLSLVRWAQRLLLIEGSRSLRGHDAHAGGRRSFLLGKDRAAERDVIVFKYPPILVDYVKTVVARGGDTLEIRDDVVFINGQDCRRPG
jgi:hypothetical protein